MIFLSLMYLFIKQKLIKIDLRLDKQTYQASSHTDNFSMGRMSIFIVTASS